MPTRECGQTPKVDQRYKKVQDLRIAKMYARIKRGLPVKGPCKG